MKANEAPEKIYFEVNNNLIGLYDSAILGMFSVKKNKTAIEYIRTDAFIEKAERYIRSVADELDRDDDVEAFISEFIKFMKGE